MPAIPLKPCRECREFLPAGKVICPKCGTVNHGAEVKITDIDPFTVLLSEDGEDAEVKRVPTHIIDPLFGSGGIAVGSTALLGGDAGAGKTTLALQLASFIAEETGRESMIIGVEQQWKALRSVAIRLQLPNRNRIRVIKAFGGLPFDFAMAIERYKPGIVFLDSITSWIGDDLSEAVPICKMFKGVCDITNSMAIIICQITKSGWFAGIKKVEHEVDWTGMFDVDSEDPLHAKPDDPRILHSFKNRNGPAPLSMFFKMTELGLVEIPDPDSESNYEED
jgi:DNA repair protein RadA/Sms